MSKQVDPSPQFYQIICATFCVIAVLSNIISAKMVKLPFHDLIIRPACYLSPHLPFKRSGYRNFWN